MAHQGLPFENPRRAPAFCPPPSISGVFHLLGCVNRLSGTLNARPKKLYALQCYLRVGLYSILSTLSPYIKLSIPPLSLGVSVLKSELRIQSIYL